MFHALLNQRRGHLDVGGVRLRDEARAVGQHVEDRIERFLGAAVGRGIGLHLAARRGRHLAFGQAEDVVVHHHIGQVRVLACQMRHVATADRERVAVPAGDQDRQFRSGQVRAGGDRARAPVQGVHSVGANEIGQTRRAADAGNVDQIGRIDAEVGERLEHAGQHAVVAAAGAPERRDLILVVAGLQFDLVQMVERGVHDSISLARLTTMAGLNGRPPQMV